MVRLQLFGGAPLEGFDIHRDLDSGKPVAVGTTSAQFNVFSKDPSLRVLTIDKISNFPIEIKTWAISGDSIATATSSDKITAQAKHTYPTDYNMLDLSPSEYDYLAT